MFILLLPSPEDQLPDRTGGHLAVNVPSGLASTKVVSVVSAPTCTCSPVRWAWAMAACSGVGSVVVARAGAMDPGAIPVRTDPSTTSPARVVQARYRGP